MRSVATWYRKGSWIGHRQRLTGTLRGSQRHRLGDVIVSRTSLLRGVVKPPQKISIDGKSDGKVAKVPKTTRQAETSNAAPKLKDIRRPLRERKRVATTEWDTEGAGSREENGGRPGESEG